MAISKQHGRLRWLSAVLVVLIAVGVFAFLAWKTRSGSPGPTAASEKPVPVETVVSESRDVPEMLAVQGFVTPRKVVDIRPQVMSTVRAVSIIEGQTVREGQRLFTLDDRGDAANSAKADALVEKDRALLDDARRTLQRNLDLKTKGFISQSAVDTSQSNVDALAATLESDRAAATAASVTRGYFDLIAPMSGRVGEIKVHVGSLVQPSMTQPMATLTQIDPIDVAFNVPEVDAQKLLALQRAGGVDVRAVIDKSAANGHLSFVDSAVDQTTGSLKAKATFNNAQELLWPGSLVSIEVALRTLPHVVVIPPRAVQVGPNGQFVYRVEANGTVSAQPVSVQYVTSDLAVVTGIPAGTTVVLEGGQNLRPGMPIVRRRAGGAP
jgi:RND family efflux transporter MFP subunit